MPSLKQLLAEGKLRVHKTSKSEVTGLLKIVERDIKDARIEALSTDRRFATAYNAALQLATLVLSCKGFRSVGAGHHFNVLQAVREILGKAHYDLIDYFDACRSKRNITDYDRAGEISDVEAEELLKEVLAFKKIVLKRVKESHPQYLK